MWTKHILITTMIVIMQSYSNYINRLLDGSSVACFTWTSSVACPQRANRLDGRHRRQLPARRCRRRSTRRWRTTAFGRRRDLFLARRSHDMHMICTWYIMIYHDISWYRHEISWYRHDMDMIWHDNDMIWHDMDMICAFWSSMSAVMSTFWTSG